MTIECPNEIQELPWSALDWCGSKNYWVLKDSTVYHQGRQKELQFSTKDLNVGETIGCVIHKDGTLHYHVNGIDRGVSWDDKLPINQVMYGFVDVFGRHNKIRSLFHYGKYTSVLI